MADDNTQPEDTNPIESARARADELGLEGDDRDDWITARMARAGYKKGPGEWISADDDDDDGPRDDDDEPVTRGEYRKIQRERKRKAAASTPPRRTPAAGSGKPAKKDNGPWW